MGEPTGGGGEVGGGGEERFPRMEVIEGEGVTILGSLPLIFPHFFDHFSFYYASPFASSASLISPNIPLGFSLIFHL